jgi:hypothetical protein
MCIVTHELPVQASGRRKFALGLTLDAHSAAPHMTFFIFILFVRVEGHTVHTVIVARRHSSPTRKSNQVSSPFTHASTIFILNY